MPTFTLGPFHGFLGLWDSVPAFLQLSPVFLPSSAVPLPIASLPFLMSFQWTHPANSSPGSAHLLLSVLLLSESVRASRTVLLNLGYAL